MALPDGVEVRGPAREKYPAILSDEALGLVAELQRELGPTRSDLLARRAQRQAMAQRDELALKPAFGPAADAVVQRGDRALDLRVVELAVGEPQGQVVGLVRVPDRMVQEVVGRHPELQLLAAGAQGERDVRRHRDAPPRCAVAGCVEGRVNRRGHEHAADGAGDRECRVTPRGELADEHLALDLEPDQEEEDRHEAVVDPVVQAQRQHSRPDPERQGDLPQSVIAIRPGRVGPREGQDGADEQHDPTGRLGRGESLEGAEQMLDEWRGGRRCRGCGVAQCHAGSLRRPPLFRNQLSTRLRPASLAR